MRLTKPHEIRATNTKYSNNQTKLEETNGNAYY